MWPSGDEISGIDKLPLRQADSMRGGDFFYYGLTHYLSLQKYTVCWNISPDDVEFNSCEAENVTFDSRQVPSQGLPGCPNL